jgi:putative solute:sodium symporter small subunit
MKVSENHQAYWRKNLRITSILLAIWFVVTYVVAYLCPRPEFHHSSAGLSASGWRAQGALVIYVAIIAYYAHYMNKLDIEHGVAEEGE